MKITDRQKDYLIAGANIAVLGVATFLILENYFDHGLVYLFANNEFLDVVYFFEHKVLWQQALLVLFFVLIEVVIGLIPAVVMYPIIGGLIGPLWGILLIFTGNIIGNTVNYYQGKWIARAFIGSGKDVKIFHRLQDGGAWSLFLIRLNPLTSFDAISYFAGALGMKFRLFFVSTITGITPMIVVGTLVGGTALKKLEWGFHFLVVVTLMYGFYSILKAKARKKII